MERSLPPGETGAVIHAGQFDHAINVRPEPPRVLIVEDEMVVAMLIEDMVAELRFEVGGVASHLVDAIALLERDSFDLAILDIYLNGEHVFPLAERLMKRGIPYMFATAYGGQVIPDAYRHLPVLRKPFSSMDLKKALLHLGQEI